MKPKDGHGKKSTSFAMMATVEPALRRPGLEQLREHIGRTMFDRVVITAPDRLARNYVQQMLLIEEFERGGCQVEFVDRPMSHDPHDQLLLPHSRSRLRV